MNGAGLSTSSDVLLRWVDINGALQMVRLSPSTAAADGTSATLVVPTYANGAFSLQLFGSSTQPLLQIVPTVQGIDVQDRTVLFGSGFVEGAGVYSFAGANVADTPPWATTSTCTTRQLQRAKRQRLPQPQRAAHARAGQRQGHHRRAAARPHSR